MHALLDKLQVHIPFVLLAGGLLERVVRERIRPEIGLPVAALDAFPLEAFQSVAQRLADAKLPVTLHAPFMDLRPGALDPQIRRVSRDRLAQAFELIPLFRPLTIVCHPSFDRDYYESTEEAWLAASIETWLSLAAAVPLGETRIALENVYEAEPGTLRRLLSACDPNRFGFCFDTGHFNVYADARLEDWLDDLAPYLCQIHLHDNRGKEDEHLPVGAGTFPFSRLFAALARRGLSPLLTLEAHSEPHLEETLANLARMKLI